MYLSSATVNLRSRTEDATAAIHAGSSPAEMLLRRVVFLSGVLSRGTSSTRLPIFVGDASGELGMERPAEFINGDTERVSADAGGSIFAVFTFQS